MVCEGGSEAEGFNAGETVIYEGGLGSQCRVGSRVLAIGHCPEVVDVGGKNDGQRS
jgi:hypothetical protein